MDLTVWQWVIGLVIAAFQIGILAYTAKYSRHSSEVKEIFDGSAAALNFQTALINMQREAAINEKRIDAQDVKIEGQARRIEELIKEKKDRDTIISQLGNEVKRLERENDNFKRYMIVLIDQIKQLGGLPPVME
jgi:hypothetical protein